MTGWTWPVLEPVAGMSHRERFAWWIGGGQLPEGLNRDGWSEFLRLLLNGLRAELGPDGTDDPPWSEAEKELYLRTACDVLSFVETCEVIGADRVLDRQLFLSIWLVEFGFSLPDKRYGPEDAVRRIMAVVTPERIDECARLSPEWTKRSTPEIARMHRVKQLIKIAGVLREYLADPEMRAVVARWEVLYPRLP
ncbi:hypothetical protein CU254_09080 [Amycolatopsis sp. AA4]|uniref:hypothetical protein n=1 Tax=Actinomycetes TaxID=1760 RepID=UPI0001B54FD9|nr:MULTISPECIES: hypothetical protein [Actinomycetes]ATY10598.1 hypothetical protein CU254_09080 [Amycolatopsis sp. AA4]EFL06101.1 predicted protein [Streptomyces sp. AA4]